MAKGMVWICKSSRTNCVFHISYEKRLQREKHLNNTHLPKLMINLSVFFLEYRTLKNSLRPTRSLLHIKIQDLCKEIETLDLYPVLKEVVEICKSELLIQRSVAMYCTQFQ